MRYEVQFTFPIEDPENRVVKKSVSKEGENPGQLCYVFEVPVNHPKAHNFGLQDLFLACQRAGYSATTNVTQK